MFDDCVTIEQIDRRKRSLVTELHPDAGGSNERFLAMMDAYNKAVERVNNPTKPAHEQTPPPNAYTQTGQPLSGTYYPQAQVFDLDKTLAFIQKSMEVAAKAAVVYTAVMEQLDAIKADKRKKARKSRRKPTAKNEQNVNSRA